MLRRRKCSLGSKERNSLCFHQAGPFPFKGEILCIPSTKAVLSMGTKVLSIWGRRCYFVWPPQPFISQKIAKLRASLQLQEAQKETEPAGRQTPMSALGQFEPSRLFHSPTAAWQGHCYNIADSPTSQPQAAWASCVQALGWGCCFSALSR